MSAIANLMARLADIFDFNQLSNRNFVVDGAHDVWSASSATITTGGNLPCVMYSGNPGTGGTATISKVLAGAGWVSRLGWGRWPGNASQWNQTVAGSTNPFKQHKVENVNLLEGGSYTFSVWLNSAASVTIPSIVVTQVFGSGGSPSANVVTTIAVGWAIPAATGTWTRFSVRVDIPSAAGKTMGTTDTVGYTGFEILYPSGVTFNVADAGWQIEPCSPSAPAIGLPTAFEYRGLQVEYARVQRYYESGAINLTTSVGGMLSFAVPKRVTPTLTTSGFTGTGGTLGLLGSNGIYQTAANSAFSGGSFIADSRQ